MKKTMNAIQRRYMIAVAAYETLTFEENEIERKYIEKNNITGDDGELVSHIWVLDDEELFDKVNAELANLPESKENNEKQNAAREELKLAENAMIEYGLSIAPAGLRDTLSKGAKSDYNIRKKLIDLVYKLDVSTVNA